MTKRRPARNNRTAYNQGFSLTQYEFTASPNEDENMTSHGRRVYFPENTFKPTYQMGIARNPAADGLYSTARVWMHLDDSGSEGFYRFPITQGADLHDQAAPTFEVSFAVANTQDMSAFTVVEHSTLTHVGIWARALTPSTDFLGIDVSEFPVGAPPYVSTAVITGAQIFPSGTGAPAGTAEAVWGTFVAREESDGTGNIRVLAQILFRPAALPASSRQSDLARLVTFVIDPVGKTVTEAASTVVTDVPFSPHQIAEGQNVPLGGGDPVSYLWCVGRYDPNYTDAYVNSTGTPDSGTHNMSPVGVWVCDDPDAMTPWRRISHIAASEQTDPTDLIANPATPDNVSLRARDLGLAFDPSWQRLTAVGVDTDASQDPHYRRQPIP